jgi:hypothetical protein
MKSNQRSAKMLGLLFLLPFFAYGLGNGLIASVIDSPGNLAGIEELKNKFLTGAILLLLNSVTVVVIGVMLFTVLAKWNRKIALGYLCIRIMESLVLIIGLISLLSLITISEEYLQGGKQGLSYFEALSSVAKAVNFWSYQVAMLVLGVGSIGFCYILYKSQLVPSSLALLGLAGYALLAMGALLEMFGYQVGIALSIPGGLFEVGIGLWLMAKGFSTSHSHKIKQSSYFSG